jgi:hypothetical protein
VGRFDFGISVATEVAIPQIVGINQDDVGSRLGSEDRRGENAKAREEIEVTHGWSDWLCARQFWQYIYEERRTSQARNEICKMRRRIEEIRRRAWRCISHGGLRQRRSQI